MGTAAVSLEKPSGTGAIAHPCPVAAQPSSAQLQALPWSRCYPSLFDSSALVPLFPAFSGQTRNAALGRVVLLACCVCARARAEQGLREGEGAGPRLAVPPASPLPSFGVAMGTGRTSRPRPPSCASLRKCRSLWMYPDFIYFCTESKASRVSFPRHRAVLSGR